MLVETHTLESSRLDGSASQELCIGLVGASGITRCRENARQVHGGEGRKLCCGGWPCSSAKNLAIGDVTAVNFLSVEWQSLLFVARFSSDGSSGGEGRRGMQCCLSRLTWSGRNMTC